ncbi:MAG: MoaD/ThiS family protein [Syntrophorhabdaceae bacterium]|nr:MoaD/ThiS family protein [Syntrophorhabdaceae bacterium]
MGVMIKLFATLRTGRFSEKVYEIKPNTTISNIIEELGLPSEQVSIIFVNGRHAKPDTILKEGDEIAMFPPIGGG